MAANNDVIELLDSDSESEQHKNSEHNDGHHPVYGTKHEYQQTLQQALGSVVKNGRSSIGQKEPRFRPLARLRPRCIQEEKREIDESEEEETSRIQPEEEKQLTHDNSSDASSSSSSSSDDDDEEEEEAEEANPRPCYYQAKRPWRNIQEEKEEIDDDPYDEESDDESAGESLEEKRKSQDVSSKRRADQPPPPEEEPLHKRRPLPEDSSCGCLKVNANNNNEDEHPEHLLISSLIAEETRGEFENYPNDSDDDAGSSDDETEDNGIQEEYSEGGNKPAATTKRTGADITMLPGEFAMLPGEFAMDCGNCRCGDKADPYGCIEDEMGRNHRPCCHNVEGKNGVVLHTELIKAREQAVQKADAFKSRSSEERELSSLKPNHVKKRREKRLKPKEIRKQDLRGLQIAADMRESQIINLRDFPAPDSIAYTHPNYAENCTKLKDLIKKASTPKDDCEEDDSEEGITVVDCFAGIGTLLVVLKRLGIRIKKYIYVDEDPIAKHVFRHNHVPSYEGNETLKSCKGSAGIAFDFYEKFEDIRDDLDGFMEKHGPIDILVGGPPCQEFSQVNAQRVGVDNESGHLFVDFGHFIMKASKHAIQGKRPLWYFAENVEIKQDDLALVEKSFNDSPFFLLDAWYWSPCSRKRGFFSNLACPKAHKSHETIGAKQCLEGEWRLPGDFFDDPNSAGRKSNTFMASLGRIDDRRMSVVRKAKGGGYIRRTFKVVEREKIMGFPPGYVERPINELYDALHPAFTSLDPKYKWEESLKEKYHGFAGAKVKLIGLGCYDGDIEKPCIELKLCPPQTGKNPSFFHPDEYAKHLIGNAYSVPVALALLSPLKELYKAVEYKGYQYEYAWKLSDECNDDF